ncbi:MAG: hypothetical protein AB7W59_00230 [Acidimicrobiia bacterium]
MSSGVQRTVRGAFTGTGAELQVRTVGFRPRAVKLVNRGGLATAEWQEGMPDASMSKRVTAGTMTFPTSDGITPLSDGFQLGADTDMNVAGELVYYEAVE